MVNLFVLTRRSGRAPKMQLSSLYFAANGAKIVVASWDQRRPGIAVVVARSVEGIRKPLPLKHGSCASRPLCSVGVRPRAASSAAVA